MFSANPSLLWVTPRSPPLGGWVYECRVVKGIRIKFSRWLPTAKLPKNLLEMERQKKAPFQRSMDWRIEGCHIIGPWPTKATLSQGIFSVEQKVKRPALNNSVFGQGRAENLQARNLSFSSALLLTRKLPSENSQATKTAGPSSLTS